MNRDDLYKRADAARQAGNLSEALEIEESLNFAPLDSATLDDATTDD